MASRRSWTDAAVRSGDARPRRMEGYTNPWEDATQAASQRAQQETRGVMATANYSSQPKASSSRIPQTSAGMRPSLAGQAQRPALNHQPQSWSSTGSVGSGQTTGNLKASSVLPPSSNLQGHGSTRRRNILRRKHSGLPQDNKNQSGGSNSGSVSTSSSSSGPRSQNSLDAASEAQFDRGLTESPMEVRVAQRVDLPKTTAHAVTIYPELDRYREARPHALADNPNVDVPFRLATHDLPPPTPQFSATASQISGFSGSPSTRWSESPGPGPYSRDTTPTSMSSQSPGLLAPIRFPTPARTRQASPAQTRPPVTRRRAASIPNEGDPLSADAQGLAAVRESLTSSSSNSTVRDADKKDINKKEKKRLSPLPPSPPPRTSSQKLRSRSHSQDEAASPLGLSRRQVQPVMTSAALVNTTTSASRKKPLTSPKATAPSRPSRDGTPDLHSHLGLPMPVIQSNLSSASLSERRHSSLLPPSSHSRALNPSPGPELPQARRRPSVGQESTQSETSRGTLRTPSPSVSTLRTRFPLFGRRNKTAGPEAAAAAEKKDKPTRKGPAAGTGHEGYGRLGTGRRRSGSVTNLVRAAPGTLSSQESLTGNQVADPFLTERMAPVVIAGGEVVENRNTSSELSRTESDASFSHPLSEIGSKNSSRISLSSKESTRLTLWPSAFPREPSQEPSIGSRRPSDSSDSEALAMKSTLAFRRSMQKLKSGDQPPPRLPKPIVTRPQVISPSVTSLDASVMSDDSVFSPLTRPVRGRTQTSTSTSSTTANSKKLTKRVKSPRRWNFFGRSHSQPAVVTNKPEPAASTVAATVQVVETKPAAFYTMDFSEQEDADVPDLEDLVREARAMGSPFLGSSNPTGRRPSASESVASAAKSRNVTSPQDATGDSRPSAGLASSRAGRVFGYPSPQPPAASERRPSFSRPLSRPQPPASGVAPALQRQESQAAQKVAPAKPSETNMVRPSVPSVQSGGPRAVAGRPSRLPQVGRIPKVISARPEQTSPKSFSRPFNRISVQLGSPRREVSVPDPDNTDFVAKGPSPPRPLTPELTQDQSTVTGGSSHAQGLVPQSTELAPDPFLGTKEFLSLSPRQNSQCTTSSSSSGLLSFADATAIVPDAATPLAEDEIWDEYNDLLGEDTIKVPPSAGSSLGRPFHLEMYSNQLGSNNVEQPLESPTVHGREMSTVDEVLRHKAEPVASSDYSRDLTVDIKAAIDASPTPEAVLSVTEIVSGLRGGRIDSMDASEQGDTLQRSSTSSKTAVQESRRSNASGSSQGSEDNSPLSQVNLRVGSMTVSKWLTFGHVLFSPAREDLVQAVGSLKRHSILVVDGLGNDDWGFYAAETYPAATFFNLSPRAPLPADHQNSTGFPLSPPNHHQIQYTSHTDKFPFGEESFTSVVYRFPAAAPESHYRNIISEARRVLKPGGYIELAVLDVDLNNMGNRGRRTVRRLKERIHANAPDTCLGSAADLILRLLGRKGFVDIKTCRVGVPVASAITRSSTGEARSAGKFAAEDRRMGQSRGKRDERTLAEMMSDESAVADESITKMVAKVGRWWYSQCYESAAAAAAANPGLGSARSMWSDKALLAECEEWGTSLKLMVCHARVPESRGRVASI